MKNFMVANRQPKNRRYKKESIEIMIKAQIENSLELSWKPDDIILVANFEFEFMGVKSIVANLNDFCFTGSKVFALKWYFENYDIDDCIWAHDLDCWQNWKFKEPEFKDVGIARYSNRKYNGGSIFWKQSAKDILDKVVTTIENGRTGGGKEHKEEPTLNDVLKSKEYKDRVTVVDNTFNVGCSGFVKRYNRSAKPIKVLHFHPYNRIAWETHALDRNQIGEIAVSIRLEKLLRKYYKLNTEVIK